MNIQNVAGQNAVMKPNSKQTQVPENKNVSQSGKHPFAAKVDSVSMQNGQQIKESHQPQGNANGVMRLMEEDHFKGVAEVRLSMNFSAQLTSSTSTRALDYLESESGNLIQGMEAQLEEIGTGFDFAKEVQSFFSSFESAVDAMFSGSGSGEGVSGPDSIFSQFRDAFANLFSSLQGLTPVSSTESSPEAEEGAEGVVAATPDSDTGTAIPAEGVSGAPSDPLPAAENEQTEDIDAAVYNAAGETSNSEPTFADSLSNLQQWFNEQLEAMQVAVDEIMAKPQFSAPSGNGVAYSKFVGMYAEMSVSTAREQSNSQSEGSITMEA